MLTFVVRLHAAEAHTLCGEVRHVSTGESIRFTSAEELVRFLEEIRAVSEAKATGRASPPAC